MEGESSGVPAGWYPDPLGLPQLRWWDGTQWSEFTSEPAASVPSESEPEVEQTLGSENVYSLDGATASFDDPLADFLNGNIARSGATGVSPVVQPGEPLPVIPEAGSGPVLPEAPSAPDAARTPDGFDPEPAQTLDQTMEVPHVIGYDDDGREFIEPVVPIVTTPGAAPVPPGGEPPESPAPPMPPQPDGDVPASSGLGEPMRQWQSEGEQQWQPAAEPQWQPEPEWARQSGNAIPDFSERPSAPEQFIVAPQAADPFASATSTVDEPADADLSETFGSRRARRQFERQRELEAPSEPLPGQSGATAQDASGSRVSSAEPPYSGAVTAPVMIQRTAAAEVSSLPSAGTSDRPPAAATPAPSDAPIGDRTESSIAAPESVQQSATVKPTYSGAAYLLAFLGVFPTAVIALMVVVLGLGEDRGLVWGVWGAAWLSGILLAFYDRLKLKLWGHTNTASPFLAIFTPILYLVARHTATKGETGHGRKVLVYWIIALLVMAAIVYLVPQVLETSVPGFTAPWTSPLTLVARVAPV